MEEFEDTKNNFEIKWPLVLSGQILSLCISSQSFWITKPRFLQKSYLLQIHLLIIVPSLQVSQNGLDVVGLLIESLGRGFRPYINTTLGPAVDRLGDTRETVRDKAHHLITKLMEVEVIEPQALFEKMQNQAFSHKNGKVREEILILMQNTLNV